MIEVKQLTKLYGTVKAVDNVSFNVNKGEIVAFLGPNGAGKSTTMRIITGFIPATTGTARVAGFDVFDDPLEVKKRIGYLPESPPLYPDMTVSEYLLFVARIKQVPSQNLFSSIQNVMDQCNLGTVRGRLIKKLSKGFQQRVGLAQALIHDPEVLILDEPTVGLDPHQIIEIRELIRALAGNHTIILSTHILPEATALCQRVLIINEGRLVAEDSPEKLSANLRKTDKVNLTLRRGNEKIVESLQAISGMLSVAHILTGEDGVWEVTAEYPIGSDLREEIARTVIENGGGLLEMKSQTLTLEDIFLKLTREEPFPPGQEETS
ncbi:MAG: ATP-binding cassette domain-containing protein [Nitrospirae bacterium]|nr:ATP-binding cassette domain-containing protein [Nitrospirota bacterium]MBI3595058.1 ATP-binding cassette domain-containing protein [Nitrospirota bacterium]